MLKAKIAAILFLLLFSSTAFLEELDEENLLEEEFELLELEQETEVEAATGWLQQIDEAPAHVIIIGCQEIRRRGWRNIAEVLEYVPGLAVIDDRTFHNVGVRGIFASGGNSQIIKVLINGQAVAFRPDSSNFFGAELLPIEAVSRVEILMGPASSLYGANALLAVINIVTFNGREAGCYSSLHGAVLEGDNLGARVAATIGTSIGPFNYFIGATFRYGDRSGLEVPGLHDMVLESERRAGEPFDEKGYPSPGWDWPARLHMMREGMSRNDLERVGSSYLLANYDFSNAWSMTFDGHFQYFDRGGEFLSFSPLTHKTRLTYLNGFSRLHFHYRPEGETVVIDVGIAAAAGKPTDDDMIAEPTLQDISYRRKFGYQALDVFGEATFSFWKQKIKIGADFTNEEQELMNIVQLDSEGREIYKPTFGKRTFANTGIFLQWFWPILDNLQLTLGTRMDYNNRARCRLSNWNCIIGSEQAPDLGQLQTTGRAALVFTLPWWKSYAKIIYASSYKPPSAYELFHEPLTMLSSEGNPNLVSLSADSIELALGARPDVGWHLWAGGYFTMLKDLTVEFKEAGKLRGRNTNGYVAGTEAGVKFRWRGLSGSVNLAYLAINRIHPNRLDTEPELLWENSPFNAWLQIGEFPKFTANGVINYALPRNHLNLNLAVHYCSPTRSSLLNNQLLYATDLNRGYHLPSVWWVDLWITTIGIKLFNNEDETLISVGIVHAPGKGVYPGRAGLDIPGPKTQVALRLNQRW